MAKWKTMAEQAAVDDFQTPPDVCEYMCAMIPAWAHTVLEPTKGIGNMLPHLSKYEVTAPDNFFDLDKSMRFDCVVMNPPFSDRSAFGLPEDFEKLGMRTGYYFLNECTKRSNHVIALMPWFTITDSDVRMREMYSFGLRSITALPRKTFQYARIQTCIFELHRGWERPTIFKVYEFETKTT